jgi:Zn-dependent protease
VFPRAFRVATIGGVDVRVDPSWFVIAIGVVLSYQRSFADGRSLSTAIAMATLASVLFTASVLIHELAHALEGTHRGAEVGGITLFLLGGVTALHSEDRRARDEFAIAAIGPWSNIVLAAAFGLGATGADQLGWAGVADVAGLLGWMNLGLALFNLVPGAPLDGGRVLRAGLWALTGDRHLATTAAAWFGLTFSTGLLVLAGWSILTVDGGVISGIWIGAIGGYMLYAARGELVRGRLSRWLAGYPAGVLAPATREVSADMTAGALTASMTPAQMLQRPGVWLVRGVDGPAGILTADALAAADPAARVDTLLRALDAVPQLSGDATADALVNLLDRDQPYVLLGDGADARLSSLDLIDQAISAARRGETDPAREGETDPARTGETNPAREGETNPAREGETDPARAGGQS